MAGQGNGMLYQLKAMLKESKSPIWRMFQVASNVTLHRLHLVLQDVMGWANSHLYRFDIGGIEYSTPDPWKMTLASFTLWIPGEQNSARLCLVRRPDSPIEYDFGDRWEH